VDLDGAAGDDALLAEIVVEWKLADREAVDACLRERTPDLGGLLVRTGRLLPADLDRARAEAVRRRSRFPRFRRYRLIAPAGEGATALIYRAWDCELARPVAVKVLKDAHGMSDVARARFRREAQAAAGLAHPNVVTVFDAGEEDDRLYLVMELVEGRLFSAELSRTPRDLRRLVGLLEKACRGVAAAHAKGIVHRDLKPANLLVGADGQPKVGDFGLAHLVDSTTALTRTGSTLGTPLYMAPEQVNAKSEDILPATDVYALGAMLYEALTGRPPHLGETAAQIYSRIAADEILPPRARDPRVPPELETVALKALDRDPRRRYPTAEALADDLARWLRGEAVLARPVPALERLRRKAVRHRAWLLPAAVLLPPALLLGLWSASRGARQARELEAVRLLDAARPALDRAFSRLYEKDTRREDLLKGAEPAARLVEEALRASPTLAAAHFLLGRAREVAGDLPAAEACHRRAVELDPSYGPAQYALGRLLLERAYLAGTGASPEEIRANRPAAERLAREGEALLQSAMSGSVGFDDALQRDVARGLLAYLRHDFDAASGIAQTALARASDGLGVEELHWLDGLARSGPEQVEAFDRALARRPQYPLALFSRALAHFAAGRTAEARDDYDRLLALQPAHARALHNRGVARTALGDLDGGLLDFDEAIRLDPAHAMGHYNRAVSRAKKGDADGARQDYDRAISLNAQHPESFNNRGILRGRAGDLAGAIEDYDRALALRPSYAAAFQNRGMARARRGDLDGALADYAEAIRLEPELLEARYNRGCARFVLGDAAGAAEDFGRLGEVAPPDWPLRRDAELHLLTALRDRPPPPAAHPGLADLRRAERALGVASPDLAIPLYERGLQAAGPPKSAPAGVQEEIARAGYNLACCYALLIPARSGPERHRLADLALEHLGKAAALDAFDAPQDCCEGRHGSLRAHAREDPDLQPLKSDPRLLKLLGTRE
jgi:serine/threonine-protein kinase